MSKSSPVRQTISIDFAELFPGEPIVIGKQTVVICPLSLEQVTTLTKQLKGLIPIFDKEGITMENFNSTENIIKMIPILFDNAPLIIEEASNIALSDLKQLPIGIIVEIIDKIVEVNLKSKDVLEKNFKSLINRFLLPEAKTPTEMKTKK